MGTKEKLECQIRSLANDVSMNDLHRFLLSKGFVLRKQRGSHRIYQIEIGKQVRSMTVVCPHGNKKSVPEYQLKQVLALLEERGNRNER